jgi:hypothetical protein
MKLKKQPCKECPFLRNSLGGWLGEMTGDPQGFLDAIDYEVMPCHMNVDREKHLLVEGEKNPCVGALQFCQNSLKFPRMARQPGTVYSNLYEQAKPNALVFQWSTEFVKHHTINNGNSIPDTL